MKTHTTKHSLKFLFIVMLSIFVVACTDNPSGTDDEGAGEEELITQVNLTLTAPDNSQVTASWEDPDGPGGNDPVISGLQLEAGTNYNGTIELLDTTDDPAEDITEEVREEAEEHQFFYSVEGDASGSVMVQITDTDANGLPIGLEFTVDVADAAGTTGTLNVVLSHYDDEPKDGETRSDETDVDIDIPLTIQ